MNLFKKIVLFLLPILVTWGFLRTTLGNETFLQDWTEIYSRAHSFPDIPQMYSDDLDHITDAWDNVDINWEFSTPVWAHYDELLEQMDAEENFFVKAGLFFESLGVGLQGIFYAIGDIVMVIPKFFTFVGQCFMLVWDTFMIPIRFVVWVWNNYLVET